MKLSKTLAIGFSLFSFLFVLCILFSNSKDVYLFDNTHFFIKNLRSDVLYYYEIGRNIAVNKLIPYKDFSLEYPPLSAVLFVFPFLFSSSLDFFFVFYRIQMLLFFIASFYVIYRLCDKKIISLLMFLPSTVFFSINRYDIVPAFFVFLSFYFLKKNQSRAFFFLSIAFLFKLYSLLLLPVFILNSKNKIKNILYFSVPIFLVFFIVFLAAPDEVFSFFTYHLQRETNRESIFFIFQYYFSNSLPFNEISFIISFLPFLLLPLIKPCFENALSFSFFVLIWFINFSKFYSPQWLVWIFPLGLLFFDKKSLIFLSGLNILNYIEYPVVWFSEIPIKLHFIGTSNFFSFIVAVRFILSLATAYFAFSRINFSRLKIRI